MHITIKQHKYSIGDGYDIYTNNKRSFSAYTEILTLDTIINICEYGTDIKKLSMERMFSLFGPTYIIQENRDEYTFSTVSWWKRHYQCTVRNTIYNIYGHSAGRYSVYKGENQIAYWTGQPVTFLEGDKYEIYADNNANSKLLIAFCLIIDNHYHDNNNNSLITFNFGRLGLEKKSFDKNWTPKI